MAALLSTALMACLAQVSVAASFKTVVLARDTIKIAGKKIRFASFDAGAINDKNQIAFYSNIYGQGVNPLNNVAIFSRLGTKTYLMARENVSTTLNGVATTLPDLTTNFLINSSGIVFWTGDDGNGKTLYNIGYRNQSPFSLFTITNTTVGTEPVADFNDRNFASVIALDDNFSTQPLTVFFESPSTGKKIVSVGDNAVGLPLGSTFQSFGAPTIDDSNNVYFTASVSGKGSKYDGIWFGQTPDPQPLVVVGQFASGTGESFTTFLDSPHPSANGKYCGLSAQTATFKGLWLETVASRSLKNIALVGTVVSDQDDGDLTIKKVNPPAVNNKGQSAFLANSTSATGVSKIALFFSKQPGTIEKIIRVGDAFTLKGANVTVTDIRFKPRGGLNNSGKMLVTLSFSNRTSGIFIATP